MAIKINSLFANSTGWDRIVEYGNKRLSEEGLENITVTIKPANNTERKHFLNQGFPMNTVLSGFTEKEDKFLVIFIVDKSDNTVDHKIANPETFVDELIINMIANHCIRHNRNT